MRESCVDIDAGIGKLLEGLGAMLEVVEARDRYTYHHCQQVLRYSAWISEEIGLGESDKRFLRVAAFLHDVGKVCLPFQVLTKSGLLTDEEWAHVRRHPIYGANLLRAFQAADPVVLAVLHHHERWDGTGYPSGLAGEQIPLLSRIIAVADSFDAMISHRPYRRALILEQAIREMEEGAGTQFDPDIVGLFLKIYRSKFVR